MLGFVSDISVLESTCVMYALMIISSEAVLMSSIGTRDRGVSTATIA